MRSFRLAFSFIRIPKLFVTLLFWPLLLGLGVAAIQITATAAYVRFVDEDLDQFRDRIDAPDTAADIVKAHLFGGIDLTAPMKVCRWVKVDGKEAPPDEACRRAPLDIAVRTANPESFDAKPFTEFFQGSAARLHVCSTCSADVVISDTPKGKVSDVYSVGGLAIYMLTESAHDKDIRSEVLQARTTIERLKDFAGTIFFHPVGLKDPVNITKASTVMILVLNTAFLIIITLWLSLVGHRKVLQYFARNDALLPLVAACGKSEFYNSLWVITILRVGFFLLATLPATFLIYVSSIPEETLNVFMGDGVHFLLWISAIISSLGAMSIIASIAELKHRHSLVSFLYKYIPVLCFAAGTMTWVFTLFSAAHSATFLQYFISSLPLFGLSPIVLAPVFKVDPTVMALHTVVASFLVVILLRLNSRWFAAHLEEI